MIQYQALRPGDAFGDRDKWRLTLSVDPLEPFLFQTWASMVDRWLDALNGQGLGYAASPVVHNRNSLAIVDIRLIPLAGRQAATVGMLADQLDRLVPGVDVIHIALIAPTESSAQAKAQREGMLSGASPKTLAGSAVEKARGAAETIGKAAGAALDPFEKLLGKGWSAVQVVFFVLAGLAALYIYKGKRLV